MRQKRAAAAHLERRSRICWYAQAAERRRIAAHERPAKGDGKENPLRKARASLPTAGRPDSRLRRLDFSSPNGACGMMPLSPFRRPGKRGADSFGGVCPSRPNRKGAPRPTPRRCPCRLRGRPGIRAGPFSLSRRWLCPAGSPPRALPCKPLRAERLFPVLAQLPSTPKLSPPPAVLPFSRKVFPALCRAPRPLVLRALRGDNKNGRSRKGNRPSASCIGPDYSGTATRKHISFRSPLAVSKKS